MNADPEVRQHLGGPVSQHESDASIDYFQRELDRNGWGPWAVEVRATGEFIGMAGLSRTEYNERVSGCETGWQLSRHAWGNGYATEAARAALSFGLLTLEFETILAVTAKDNLRAQAVMRRIGMMRDAELDFLDTTSPDRSPRASVVYRIDRL